MPSDENKKPNWIPLIIIGIIIIAGAAFLYASSSSNNSGKDLEMATTTLNTQQAMNDQQNPENATSESNSNTKSDTSTGASDAHADQPVVPAQPTAPVTKLQITDVKEGTGPGAKAGDKVTVQYTGWLTDGTKFDSSLDHGQAFSFNLGAGQVIKGWDEGVVGMKVGGKRKLVIPSNLGYGSNGTPGGPIPPNATLLFDVELVKIN